MASLFDTGIFSINGIDGAVMVGAKLYWYDAGTTTPKNTYADEELETANANPVVANASGRFPAIWLDDTGYKFVLTTATGNPTAPLVTRDNVATTRPTIFDAVQNVTVSPMGNTPDTLTSYMLSGDTKVANASEREFMHILGFRNNQGYGGSPNNDKVTSYRSMEIYTGGTDGWVDNTLLNLITNDGVNSHLLEADFNMISTNRYGTGVGGAGLDNGLKVDGVTPIGSYAAIGLAVTGIATASGTMTTMYLAAGVTPLAQRGYTTGAYGGVQSGFEDDSNAQVAFRACGSNTDIIDTSAALASGSAMLIGNEQSIQALTTASARRFMLMLDTSSNLLIGCDALGVAVTNIITASPVLPRTDDTISLGATGARFSAVWAANGTIQTSDPALKDIDGGIDSTVAMGLLDAIEPITFRWKQGGQAQKFRTEIQSVPVFRTVTVERPVIEMRDGVAVHVMRSVEQQEPVMDVVPVFNEDGSPKYVANDRKDGKVVLARLTHHVQRTEEKEAEVPYWEPEPGHRTHWGWNADNVKAAFDSAGMDFGGYVVGEDGTKALRPDQLIPVLWAAVKALSARVEALENV